MLFRSPTLHFWVFSSNCLAYGLFHAKMSTNGSRVWITGLIIFSYRFFYGLLFKPATHQKYCKRCKFLASVGRQKAKKASVSGGFRGSSPGPSLRAPPPDPRYRLALPRSPWPTHFLTPSGAYGKGLYYSDKKTKALER